MSKTVKAHDLEFEVFLTEAAIRQRVTELGNAISSDYAGKKPLLLGVLNGAFMFAADLLRRIDTDCEIAFIKFASYRGTESTGEVRELIGLDTEVKGRHIIVVEDIIDSGRTMAKFLPELRTQGPASVEVAALLLKPDSVEVPVDIKYLGFSIPSDFVIGYGLDYDGLARNFADIYRLVEPS